MRQNRSCVYAQEGYDCEGDVLLQIGDLHAGGIVFQVNQDNTGLVADMSSLGQMSWLEAMAAADSSTSGGYDDWYLPSIEELELIYINISMCSTLDPIILPSGIPWVSIGGGFINQRYWSSTLYIIVPGEAVDIVVDGYLVWQEDIENTENTYAYNIHFGWCAELVQAYHNAFNGVGPLWVVHAIRAF